MDHMDRINCNFDIAMMDDNFDITTAGNSDEDCTVHHKSGAVLLDLIVSHLLVLRIVDHGCNNQARMFYVENYHDDSVFNHD